MADKACTVRKPRFTRVEACPTGKAKTLTLVKHHQPKNECIKYSSRRCRDLECQKITEKLQCSLTKGVDEKGYWLIGKKLQEALQNYHMVMDFGQTIDSGRWSFISKELASEISTKTAGSIVSSLFQSVNLLKNKPRKSGTYTVQAELSLGGDSGTFSWDNLFRSVCCLVARLGYTDSDFTQRLRQYSTSGGSSTVLFDLTRDQVELCIGLLSEQCQKLIHEGVLCCLPQSLHVTSMEDLIVMIKCIHCIFKGTPSESMPAPEHTANCVVSKVLLRVIDHANIHCISMMRDEASDSRTKLYEAANLALDTISELVKIKHNACAMLCPLVVDVSTDGVESVLSNPIRKNMIEVIQTSFSVIPVATLEIGTSLNDQYVLVWQRLVYHACWAMLSVVEAAHAIQKVNQSRVMNSAEGMLLADMDGSSVARRIRVLLLYGSQERNDLSCQGNSLVVDERIDFIKFTRIISMYLLASIARSCSFLISSHWDLFLSDSDKTLPSSRKIRGYECCPLLSRISRGSCKRDHEQMTAALSAVEELIRNIPFKQMLTMANVKVKPFNASNIKRHSSGLNSSSVVDRMYGAISLAINALVDELEASWSRLNSKIGFKEVESITLILGVLRTIMANVPFDNESITNSLNDGVGRELSLVFFIFLNLTTSPTLTSASYPIHSAAASVIMSSMGGKVTQSGSLTEIPIPTRLWLHQNIKVIARLLCICHSSVDTQKGDSQMFVIIERLDILQSVFRVAPCIVAEAEIQALVIEVILHYLSTARENKLRVKGCELFTSLLMGRQDFGSEEESLKIAFSIVNFQIIPAVCYCLKDSDILLNTSAVSALAALSPLDWFFFCNWQDVSISAVETLILVIQLCMVKPSGDLINSKYRKQSSNARAEVCKSLGKICTSLLGPEMEKCMSETSLSDQRKRMKVCSLCNVLYDEGMVALLDSCRDPCASVRGMAIFAVGNLSLALNQSEGKIVLQSEARHLDLCNVALCLLQEDDDKVTGNAIRTISHLIKGLFSLPTYSDSWAAENDVIKVLGSASEILSKRIHLVLLEASGVGLERSWRQRSSAKKHAWGACRGLASMLSNRIVSRKCIARQVEFAIKCLVGCLDQALVLHFKIVSSAVSSLRSVSLDVWQNLSGEESVVGMAIKGCVGILSSPEASRLVIANTALICFVLSVMSLTNLFLNQKSLQARCRFYGEDMLKDLNTLLATLLVISNWKNYLSLSNKEDTTGDHEFLYFWLVESYHMNSVQKSYVFKSLETALEAGKHPNPLLVQKFACRALKEQRKCNTSAENKPEVVEALDDRRSSFHDMDDSEDEL